MYVCARVHVCVHVCVHLCVRVMLSDLYQKLSVAPVPSKSGTLRR